jgi:aspartokinase/homoserine dehydrogenase 1
MKVIKFGGTSVGEAPAIEQICHILRDKKIQEDRYAIIVSAIGGITEKLVKCANFAEKTNEKYHILFDEIEIKHLNIIRELFAIFPKKSFISRIIKYLNNLELFYDSIYKNSYLSKISLDKIMNFGELISSYLINEKLKEIGFISTWKDSRELIVIENQYESAQVNFTKSNLNIKFSFIKENTPYIILPGFIASSTEKETTVLNRGGSDYSASILSAALQAELLEIWTDVSGMMTAPPKIVLRASTVENISYLEAIALSHFGTKVIYTPTLLSSMKKNITVMIKNTLAPLDRGTLIFTSFKSIITGITGMQNITLLTLVKKLGTPGCPHFLIKQSNYELYIEKQNLREFTNDISIHHSIDKELCIITVIVDDMKNISVTSGSMFSTFGKESIKLRVIISTEKNISAVIEKKDFKKSMITLHDIFFEKPYKKIHIFIAGLGQVVNKLIEQLHKQKDYLVEELHMHIRVIGICHINRIYFNIQGINIENINNLNPNIKLVSSVSIEDFIVKLFNLNLCNSIFIDNTDRKDICSIYIDLIRKRIGIVTFNNIACAYSYNEYKKIKNIARYFKAPFVFEPNKNNGIKNTLNFLVKSGDKIHLIDALLSVSFNFILKKGYFIDIVSESQKIGFTEFEIRTDLSGIDVIRKILIIVSECSEYIELEDIKQISLLPKRCIKAFTIDSFYQELISNVENRENV